MLWLAQSTRLLTSSSNPFSFAEDTIYIHILKIIAPQKTTQKNEKSENFVSGADFDSKGFNQPSDNVR